MLDGTPLQSRLLETGLFALCAVLGAYGYLNDSSVRILLVVVGVSLLGVVVSGSRLVLGLRD